MTEVTPVMRNATSDLGADKCPPINYIVFKVIKEDSSHLFPSLIFTCNTYRVGVDGYNLSLCIRNKLR